MDFDTREIRRMEMKRYQDDGKGSKKGTVAIVVLLLLNIGLMTYIAYDKGLLDRVVEQFKKEEKKDETTEVIRKELSLEDETVNTLYSYLAPIKEEVTSTSEVRAQDLSQDDGKAIGLALLREEDFEEVDGTYKIKNILLEEAVAKILGEGFFYQKASMEKMYYVRYSDSLQGVVRLVYDEVLDSYTTTFEERDFTVDMAHSKLVKAESRGNKILLIDKVIYSSYNEEAETYSIYGDYNKTDLLDEVTDIENMEIDNYLSDAEEFVYTFEKYSSGYQFISSKMQEKV